jgi:hypothetical protein
MFFDLEILLLHTVLPIQNQQEIQKCIEKIMVSSWFNDVGDSTLVQQTCMHHDFHVADVNEYLLNASDQGISSAVESLRRHVHSFFEIAPKSQDILRIILPPETFIMFACTYLASSKFLTVTQLRQYVCAIADILLGYSSILDIDPAGNPAHAFIVFNVLQPEASARTRSRDRCMSLRNLWDALPHICGDLRDSKFEEVKLGLAARSSFVAL